MTNEELKKLFIKEVHAAARARYAVEVFADMVRTMALALESPLTLGERHAELEDEFEQIKGRYTEDEFTHFHEAFAIVALALMRHREDFLGHALENLGAANTHNGQFLTPVHLSRFIAKVNCRGLDYTPGKIIPLSDPACGSSVLLIEGAEAMIADGVRQADILIHAGDIDGRACDISYVQLSLLGYAAVVQHMDALRDAPHFAGPLHARLLLALHAHEEGRGMNRLKYVGKGIIVDCDTQDIVSPRAVVEAYNRLACVLRDTNALVDDLRTTLKTALDALCYANQKEEKSHV